MHPHIVPVSTYLKVAAALAVLLVLTVLAAQVDLEFWNTPLALAIALAKAFLIVLYFMHVRYGSPLLRIFAAGGFLWLGILFALTLADYFTRPVTAPHTAGDAIAGFMGSQHQNSQNAASRLDGSAGDRSLNPPPRDRD